MTRASKEVLVLASLDFEIAKEGNLSHGRTLDPKRVNVKVFRDRMEVIPS